jgi:RNA polymerase sigma factor (TIGR02999 family)
MAAARQGETTSILRDLAGGDATAASRLFPLVYDDLRAIAGNLMRRERHGHTLQPTAVVHEAFLRLAGSADISWESRAHFLNIAARAMRQLLVDHARAREAAKRGGDVPRITLDSALDLASGGGPDVDVLALHEALERLAAEHERPARVVEMRFFGGLTAEEAAHVLGVSVPTVNDDWALARAWLHRLLHPT